MGASHGGPELVRFATNLVRVSTHPGQRPYPVLDAEVALEWRATHPYRVAVHSRTPSMGAAVEWHFARELVVDGGGAGDLWIDRGATRVTFVLNYPDGYAELQVAREWVDGFTEAMLTEMPFGSEPALTDPTWEAAFDALLATARGDA